MKRSCHNFLLLVWVFTVIGYFQVLLAQHPYYYQITDEDGLPSNEVYCAIQDEKGFMWIGCEAGLFRYDGFTFKPYTNRRQNGKAISSLKFDASGTLWCQNFSGQIYCVKEDSLAIFADVQDRVKMHPGFDVDDQGNLFIGVPNGVLKLNPQGEEELLLENKINARDVKCLEKGELFIYTHDRKFVETTNGITGIRESYQPHYPPDVCWIDKRSESGTMLFINNRESVYHLSYVRNPKETDDDWLQGIPPSTVFYTFYHVYKGISFCTTSNGVYQISHFPDTTFPFLFQGEKISNMFVDRENNFWFTSLENGIYVVPNLDFYVLNKSNSSLADHNISSLLKRDENNLLIGTFSGEIYNLDLRTNQLTLLPQDPELRYRSASSMVQLDKGILASRGNISFFNSEVNAEKTQSFAYIRDFIILGDCLFYCCSDGSAKIMINTQSSQLLTESNVFFSNRSSKFVEYDDQHQVIWFAQSNGLYFLKHDSLVAVKDHQNSIYPTALSYQNGILWVGTIDQGVIGMVNGEIKYRLNKTNLLRGNAVTTLYAKDSLLIVATENGAQLINLSDRTTDFLDLTDGLNTNDINTFLLDKNQLYIGSTKGLYLIELTSIHPNEVRPNIQFDWVYVNGQKFSPDEVHELNYNDELTLQFSSASLKSRSQMTFRYRLNESSEWNHLEGSIRELKLNSLPPNEYRFQIYAVNEDGFESKFPATLNFTVNAPFWQRWWFYALLVLVTLLGAAAIYSLRIRSIRRKALMKEKLVQSQLRAIKAQMNPHFIFNSLNSIQDLILQQDVKNSYHYLNKFSTLMRKVLDATETEKISLADECEFLKIYLELEKLRFGDDFLFNIQISDQLDQHRTELPAMILQPFVENAVKHGLLHKKGLKQLTISFTPGHAKKGLICLIKDNGVGRKRSQEIKARQEIKHTSFATRAIENRIDLLNNQDHYRFEISVRDLFEGDNPSGTEVELIIRQN